MDELLDWEQDSWCSEVQPREAVRGVATTADGSPGRGGQSCAPYSSPFSLGLLASAFPSPFVPVGVGVGSLVPVCACGGWRQYQVLLYHSPSYLLFFFNGCFACMHTTCV